jgi:Hint domain
MPTTYTDQFFVMDPGNPPAVGTNLTVQNYDFVDTDDNGFIQPNVGDTANGAEVTSVWVDDTITVIMNGSTVTITGVTFYLDGQPAIFTPTDGTVLSDATFQSSTYVVSSTQIDVGDFGPPCFTPGTMIETDRGARAIEALQPGDLVLTRDNGCQPVLWISSRTVPARGRFAPVVFAPGALGNPVALAVSPQHRMLITGWQAELFFGEEEVLVPAKHLVNGDTIRQIEAPEVTYIHLLFVDHEIVMAGGVPSESYFLGHALREDRNGARAELRALFPELEGVASTLMPARQIVRRYEGELLAA